MKPQQKFKKMGIFRKQVIFGPKIIQQSSYLHDFGSLQSVIIESPRSLRKYYAKFDSQKRFQGTSSHYLIVISTFGWSTNTTVLSRVMWLPRKGGNVFPKQIFCLVTISNYICSRYRYTYISSPCTFFAQYQKMVVEKALQGSATFFALCTGVFHASKSYKKS